MRIRGFLILGAVAAAAFAAGALAQDVAPAALRWIGAAPSHLSYERYDMSVGVTAGQAPRRAQRIEEDREVLNVPGLYPTFASTVKSRLDALTGALSKDEKKQKTALTKASKALAATAGDLGKMIGAASKAVAPLEPVFAEDAQLKGAFDLIVNDLHA